MSAFKVVAQTTDPYCFSDRHSPENSRIKGNINLKILVCLLEGRGGGGGAERGTLKSLITVEIRISEGFLYLKSSDWINKTKR